MWAVEVRVKVSDYSQARDALRTEVVPAVKQAPGFQSGLWLSPTGGASGGEGLSVVCFDSEDNARQAAAGVRDNAPAHVEVVDVEVREVAASA
jgi:hypothetical protein